MTEALHDLCLSQELVQVFMVVESNWMYGMK